MIKRAFILSRPQDYGIATECRERMIALGWEAQVMIDAREWENAPQDAIHANYSTLGKGMFGNSCAMGIMDGIFSNSSHGDIVMKMDCDIFLSQEASEWFSTPIKCKAMLVNYHGKIQTWGGVWSSTREQLLEARDVLSTLAKCMCAESFLNLKSFCLTKDGIEESKEIVNQWKRGDEIGFAATLPICRQTNRTFFK